ncbi:hypothetical protein ACE6H2_026209 [Prunus campanulata]
MSAENDRKYIHIQERICFFYLYIYDRYRVSRKEIEKENEFYAWFAGVSFS